MALPTIDLRRVRPHGNPPSRAGGFEELASIVLVSDIVDWPTDTEFTRFGNPDGGREGRGVLPDGSVWAWQAKFHLQFDSSAASQLTTSVKRVLETEPELTRYFVVLPIDLPAGDTDVLTSAHTRWQIKVEEWRDLATARGMDVEFVFVGEHEVVSALTSPANEGRVRYWFDTDLLGRTTQEQHLRDQLARARDRYDAQLHVDVAPMKVIEALGRVESYRDRWRVVLADLRRATRFGWRNPADESEDGFEAFAQALPAAAAACEAADRALEGCIDRLERSSGPMDVDSPLADAADRLSEVSQLLRDHRRREHGYVNGDAHLYNSIRSASSAVYNAQSLARSVATAASRSGFALITGRGGTGKTHLLCHAAEERIARGLPTVLLLGQSFETASPFDEVARLAGIGGGGRHLLQVLDAAGEASGCIALLIIDAINESDPPLAWRDDLAVLRSAARDYPHVGVAVSCRSEFLEGLVDADISPRVEHHGLAESTDEALERYCGHFGLEYPTFPPLNPELSNPLYLKLMCKSMRASGERRFQRGSQGLSAVCDSFVGAVTITLAAPTRCDFDPASDVVRTVVSELAQLGDAYVDRGTAQEICDRLLPNRPWSRSLLNGLLKEGLLIDAGPDRIGFGYQRVGDVARAQALSGAGIEGIKAWLLEHADAPWQHRGTAVALTTVVPEDQGVELIDLAADEDGAVSLQLVEAFIDSLPLRSSNAVTDRTCDITKRLLDHPRFSDEGWNALLRLAAVPDHRLNARWLHDRLTEIGLSKRDGTWSQFLTYKLTDDESTTVSRLISWAWPDGQRAPDAPDEVAELAIVALAWMLTTTDRSVRDQATKAIVSLATPSPDPLARELPGFADVDDPYVTERLAAAACGTVLRTRETSSIHRLADAVLQLLNEQLPDHILTRDYAQTVWREATASGWSGTTPEPETSEWPGRELPSRDEIEALCQAPEYAYSSIWSSLTGIGGDFGRYVLESALDDLTMKGTRPSRKVAERDIFERVRELGWTPERFGDIDRQRTGHVPEVERVGKKYQWIAFYETVGRATDVYDVGRVWADESEPYTHLEQVVWRDIDPTLLSHGRRASDDTRPSTPWHSPVDVVFDIDLIGTPAADMDTAGIPDPLGTIQVTDDEGASWTTLNTFRRWRQLLPPEVEALEAPSLEITMSLTTFAMRQEDLDVLVDWLDDRGTQNNWLLRTAQPSNLLMGTHPHGPRWDALAGPIDFEEHGLGQTPCEVWPTSAWYSGTGTSRDASTAEPVTGYVPSRWLVEQADAKEHVDFSWCDSAGRLVIQDPVSAGEPAALLVRSDLIDGIATNGFALLWVVRAEKHWRQSALHGRQDAEEPYRWVEAQALYGPGEAGVALIDSAAGRYRPGPALEVPLAWP